MYLHIKAFERVCYRARRVHSCVLRLVVDAAVYLVEALPHRLHKDEVAVLNHVHCSSFGVGCHLGVGCHVGVGCHLGVGHHLGDGYQQGVGRHLGVGHHLGGGY